MKVEQIPERPGEFGKTNGDNANESESGNYGQVEHTPTLGGYGSIPSKHQIERHRQILSDLDSMVDWNQGVEESLREMTDEQIRQFLRSDERLRQETTLGEYIQDEVTSRFNLESETISGFYSFFEKLEKIRIRRLKIESFAAIMAGFALFTGASISFYTLESIFVRVAASALLFISAISVIAIGVMNFINEPS